MNFSKRWIFFSRIGLCMALGTPLSVLGQVINSVEVIPSSPCVGTDLTINVDGSPGVCSDVTVNIGVGAPLPPQTGSLPLPFLKNNGYPAAGDYQVTVTSSDCNVNIPGGSVAVTARNCTYGQVSDGTLYPVSVVSIVQAAQNLVRLAPKITGGPWGAPVQAGNEAPFLLVGENFPRSDAEGEVRMRIGEAGEWFKLDTWAWNQIGNGVALQVPMMAGVPDGPAVIQVVTLPEQIASNEWPVNFVAARKVKRLYDEDVELVSCGTDGNHDCCLPFFADPDNVDFPGFEVFNACTPPENVSFWGNHENNWGLEPADEGTDTYRIDLANGWAIHSIELFLDGTDGFWIVAQTSDGSPVGQSSWEENIFWWVTPNDELEYSGYVYIIGPWQVPHK